MHFNMLAEGARIVDPEEMDVAWEQLCKHVSMTTKYASNNRRTAVGVVFCGARPTL
jgi:hypothetical protein